MSSTYTFTGPCKHSWDVDFTACTEKSLPSCACGNPLVLNPGACPECGVVPRFLDLPRWEHMGTGLFNVASVMKLEIYK